MAWSERVLRLEVRVMFAELCPSPYADMLRWAWAARSYDRARKAVAYRMNRTAERRRIAEADRRLRAMDGDRVCELQRERAHRWYDAAKKDPEKMAKLIARRRRSKVAARARSISALWPALTDDAVRAILTSVAWLLWPT